MTEKLEITGENFKLAVEQLGDCLAAVISKPKARILPFLTKDEKAAVEQAKKVLILLGGVSGAEDGRAIIWRIKAEKIFLITKTGKKIMFGMQEAKTGARGPIVNRDFLRRWLVSPDSLHAVKEAIELYAAIAEIKNDIEANREIAYY